MNNPVKKKEQPGMDNPVKTGATKNGQPSENRRSNYEWTIQCKQKEQPRMDNPVKTERAT